MTKRANLAHEDEAFLSSDAGRPIRILAEYLKPLDAFQSAGIRDTVVFFGSARLREDGPMGHYYREARELARRVTEWSNAMKAPAHRFVVCSGGGGGIMEAANRGAADAGGPSVGLNIGLPHEQRPNDYITPELTLEFRYFFTRKLWFAHLARAMIAFPGGLGTLDELCEILTLSQTRKLSRPIRVFLYGRAYWEEIINFQALVRYGMISEKDLELFRFVESPEEAFQALQEGLAEDFEDISPAFARSLCCDPDDPQQPG